MKNIMIGCPGACSAEKYIVVRGEVVQLVLKLRPAGLLGVRCGLKLGRPSICSLGPASQFFRRFGRVPPPSD